MIDKRLAELRQLLDKHKFFGYIIPTTDEYLSEYVPAYAKRLEYITGFTGSNGLAVILKEIVIFFTDGRYINQCASQLDSNLFEIFDLNMLPNFQWSNYLEDDAIIAYDSKLFTYRTLQHFIDLKLQAYEKNLIDEIWLDQPARPNSKIYDYPIKYAGSDYTDKIKKCVDILNDHSAESLVITDPASVCWLLNIRAHDIEFSPLLLANAIITREKIYLFTNRSRFDGSLYRDGMEVLPENDFANIIVAQTGIILFDEFQCSSYIVDLIKSKKHKSIRNPCSLWKACKNDVEIQYMKQGHTQDAVAVCEMLAFIANNDISDFTEYDLGQKVTEFRSKGKEYVFDSFPSICGYQDNAAVIHYCASRDLAKKITGHGLLLIDSGGQYMGATTDITRTISIGKPKRSYREYYTRVLKGNIALGSVVFPKGKVTGAHLDVLARQYLWAEGKDYAHGTGHGVGSFLSVHEGPQNISLAGIGTKLAKGMIISNEPGYYVPGEFGIRIENMMYVKEAKMPGFLEFKTLTLVPYEKKLIDIDMMTKQELEYLRSYYLEIESKIMPLLSAGARKWLKNQLVM